jgi:predicted amidohydrolase YtcJ
MRSAILSLCLFGLTAGCDGGPADTPDAIFHNATIYTGVDGQQPVGAVSVRAGRIVAVGDAASILSSAGPATEMVDLGGGFLYPGFTDAHAHLYGIGERERTLNLAGVNSLADLLDAVQEAARSLPPGRPLTGRGWIETHWPEGRVPSRQDLDAVVSDRPVVLERADGHALVANSFALQAVGLDGPPAAQPAGGRIELDARGVPTGILIDNAMAPMAALVDVPGEAEVRAVYATAMDREVSLGWTGIHNMSVIGSHVATLNAMAAAGQVKMRIYNAVDGAAFDLVTTAGLWGETADGLVTTRAIKLYMDGALGSRGALLSAPYADRPDIKGLQTAEEAATLAVFSRAIAAGIQVAFHAIGDEGNRLALSWMEKAFAAASVRGVDRRWRIEHAQILHVEDIPRFRELGVIPSMQPSHAIGDLYFAPARLGEERLAGAYAWRSLIDAGSVIAGGSDAPVEVGDPRIEFYAAVVRRDLKGNAGDDWRPEQAVTRAEALKMFTLWPAVAAFRERDLGTIEPGKLADFTGFSGDLMTLPEADILTAQPVITVVNGKTVYRRSGPA